MFQFIGGRRRKRRKGRQWFGSEGRRGATTTLERNPNKKPDDGNPEIETKESVLCEIDDVKFPGLGYRADKQEEMKANYECQVVIPEFLYHKLFMYAKNTKEEISGMGLVECSDSVIFVTDIFIVKQVNSMANTKIDNEDLARYTQELIKLYDAGDKRKNPANMKLWWHSHANGGVYWSGTDDKTCEEYNNDSWLIAFVINHDRKLLCRMEVYSPIRFTVENVPVDVVSDNPYLEALEKKCREEIDKKCSKKEYGKRGFHTNDDDYWKDKYKDYDYRNNKPEEKVEKNEEVVESKVQEKSKDGKGTAITLFKKDGSKETHIVKAGESIGQHILHPDSPVDEFEDAYIENRPTHYMGLEVIDRYGIIWYWDGQARDYYPHYQDRPLSESEYAFVAEALASGIIIDVNTDLIGN